MASQQVRRYRFGPLERRGIVDELRTGQAAVVAGSLIGVVVLLQLSSSPAVVFGALLLATAAAGIAFYPLYGRTPEEWVPIVWAWTLRRARGRTRHRSTAPTRGRRAIPSGLARTTSSCRSRCRKRSARSTSLPLLCVESRSAWSRTARPTLTPRCSPSACARSDCWTAQSRSAGWPAGVPCSRASPARTVPCDACSGWSAPCRRTVTKSPDIYRRSATPPSRSLPLPWRPTSSWSSRPER